MSETVSRDLWEALVAKMRAGGSSEEAIAIEADKRATNPRLYDSAVAVWELDRPDVLSACIEDGSIDPDAPTIRTGQTLLYLAIVKGRIRSVRALLAAGADPRVRHSEHDYLYWAAFADAPPPVVEALLAACERAGITPSEQTLSVARSRARPETVALLERWRAGERAPHFADATDSERDPDALAPGDRVRVKSGPFATSKGVVASLVEGTSKLVVTVSVFGRDVDATLDRAELEPVH